MAVTVMLCFARSGGTLLNQCLGCLPNVVILSEINPLGGGWGVRGKESYTTVRSQAEHWYGIDLSSDDFAEGILELDKICQRHGKHLIVRDWSFVDFFPHDANGFNPPNRFLTLDALRGRCDLHPFGFVRDAIDVWISRGTPDPEEFFLYYKCYVDALRSLDVPIFKYEEFCRDPRKVIQCICECVRLEYSESFWQYASFKKVNGDVQVKGGSRGMNQGNIAPLPRRLLDKDKIRVINSSEDMKEANRLLDYPQSYSTDHHKFEKDNNIEKGEVAFNKGDLKEAEKYFLEALKTDSRKKEAYNNLGVIAFQRQHIEKSVDYFTKTLEIDPFYRDTIINYSVLLRSLDRVHEITPILETVVDKVPHDKELNHLLNEVCLTKRSQAKIAVLCLPGWESFLCDIVDYLKTKYDVRTCFSDNMREVESAIRWADIVWLEWAHELAVSVTNHPALLEGKRVICRLHSYEALAGYPQKIKWENVHDLIFVAEHIKQIVQNQIPSIGRRVRCIHVISNGIDLNKFPFKERKKGKNLAFLGSVNYKKGPMLLFHAFLDLVQRKPCKNHRLSFQIQ